MAQLGFILLATLLASTQSINLDVDASNSKLQRDLDEFLQLIPSQQVQRLAVQYFIMDKEFRELLKFIKTNDFKDFWSLIFSQSMSRDFIDFAQSHGVDLIDRINSIANMLGLPPYPVVYLGNEMDVDKLTGGISGFFKDVEKLLPKEKLKKLFEQKCTENPEFKKLFGILDFDRIEKFMKASEVAMKVMKFFEKFGVDTKYYYEVIRKGLKIP